VSDPVLAVENLAVHFATSRGPARAVDGVSFALAPGQRLGLVGESGSGKSTTVLALMRMIRPPGRIVRGSVRVGDLDMLAATPAQVRQARFSRIALVPQGAMNALNPVLTVGAQVDDLLLAHDTPLGSADRRRHVEALMGRVGLDAAVVDRFPHELSGGMKQRVCIAMAIALSPRVILADEPTSALDVMVQKQVLRTLVAVQRDLGAGVVLIGHDMALMAQFAHVVGVMYAGSLVEIGPTAALFSDPRHPYTRLLIASLPSFERRLTFRGIPGLPPSLVDPPPGCPFHPRCPRAESRCAADAPAERELPGGRRVRCHFADEEAA
jgi:peptide/nickel transport system ATP-binding protein